MDGKGFQALVAQLGDLSAVQRDALIAALKRKLPIDEAVCSTHVFVPIRLAAIAVPRTSAVGVHKAA